MLQRLLDLAALLLQLQDQVLQLYWVVLADLLQVPVYLPEVDYNCFFFFDVIARFLLGDGARLKPLDLHCNFVPGEVFG